MAGRPKRRARLARMNPVRQRRAKRYWGRGQGGQGGQGGAPKLSKLQQALADVEEAILGLAPFVGSQAEFDAVLGLSSAVSNLHAAGVSLPWGATEDHEGKTVNDWRERWRGRGSSRAWG